jgi:putative ABC transport system substrate-binding protein
MPAVGFLAPLSIDEEQLRGFRQGLKQAGVVEGENVSVLYRSAENEMDRLPALADDLARRRVAVIATATVPAAFAAKAATATIPILFVAAEDLARLGLVANLARPGGNLTGINIFAVELVTKRLHLLRELVPAAARVAVLVDPTSTTTARTTLEEAESAARAIGLQIQVLNARNGREIGAAFAPFERERPDALFVATGPLFTVRRAQLASLAARHLIPMSSSNRQITEAGGLKLRTQHCGRFSGSRHLCRPHPQGRETCRLTGVAVEQIRAGHQRRDRADTWTHNTGVSAQHRR